MKEIVETEVVYIGGRKDGMLVRPSLVKDLIAFNQTNLPIIVSNDFYDGDYPIAVNEYYYFEENNGKIVFKLGKTEKVEINDI